MIDIVLTVSLLLMRLLLLIGSKIAEYLTYLFLLDLLFLGVLVMFILPAAWGGENHVVDQLVYAWAVGIVEYFTHYALQECFVLKLWLFVELVFRFFFPFRVTVVMLVFCTFLLRFGSDETVQIGLRCVKF